MTDPEGGLNEIQARRLGSAVRSLRESLQEVALCLRPAGLEQRLRLTGFDIPDDTAREIEAMVASLAGDVDELALLLEEEPPAVSARRCVSAAASYAWTVAAGLARPGPGETAPLGIPAAAAPLQRLSAGFLRLARLAEGAPATAEHPERDAR
jgi:hypothetical protein